MTAHALPPPPPLSRDRQVARLLCTSAKAGTGGILTASRGKLRRLFCLQKGSIVFATSNLVEEQFVEYLVRIAAISPRVYTEAIEESQKRNTKAVAHLIKSGTPGPQALERGMEGLIRELLSSTLEWPDGFCEFEKGLPRLDGEIMVSLDPRELVYAHAKRYPVALDALRIRIGPPDLRPVVVAPAAANGASSDALGSYLLERCDGTTELSELVKDSPADEVATLRAIYGFLLTGELDPEDRQARRDREARLRENTLSREECLGRLTMVAGQDHYGVLGVDRTAKPKVIREAYYSLARRYHPDRFRSGPLVDLLTRFEEFFTLVTDAHNTLSDPLRRAEYNEHLASVQGPADDQAADSGYLAKQNFLRGRALAASRKYTEAVTFLENAVSLDPTHAEYHVELGLVLSLNPRHREDAERYLLQAIKLDPAVIKAYVVLGQMYIKAGKNARAGRMAREALRWEPGHPEASELLLAAGDETDEQDDLQKALFG